MDTDSSLENTSSKRKTNYLTVIGITISILGILCIFGLVIGLGTSPFASKEKNSYNRKKQSVFETEVFEFRSRDNNINVDWKTASPSMLSSVELHQISDISVGELISGFEELGYNWSIKSPSEKFIPRIYLDYLPSDITEIISPDKRKRLFIATLLPLVLRVNEEIILDRNRLSRIQQKIFDGEQVNNEELDWLAKTADRYEVDSDNIAELFKCIDIVPPSLALAQAAEESGWGTSRFAREGNALFGIYTYNESSGMRPLRRDENQGHYVKTYESLIETVRAYMHNLNYHFAYEDFRKKRSDMRREGNKLDGLTLSKELIRYSQRGADYIKALGNIIRANNLDELDGLRLGSEHFTKNLDQEKT